MYNNCPAPINTVMGLIKHLNGSELKDILNNDDLFEPYAKELKVDEEFVTEKEMLVASSRSLAEFNLTKEPELASTKEIVCELYKVADEKYKRVIELVNTLKQRSSRVNSETILAQLQTAASETEEKSEKLYEEFVSNRTETEVFLEEFLKQRKDMHMRKVKAEKMAELLSRRNSSFRSSNINAQQPIPAGYPQPGYPNSSYFQPSALPYPNIPNNMPMPNNPFMNRQF